MWSIAHLQRAILAPRDILRIISPNFHLHVTNYTRLCVLMFFNCVRVSVVWTTSWYDSIVVVLVFEDIIRARFSMRS